MGGGEPRRGKVHGAAEVDCGMIEGETTGRSPEIERIALLAASEAAIDLPGKVNGEGTAGVGAKEPRARRR